MRQPGAELRAMTESELNSFKCSGCKAKATHVASWIFQQPRHKSLRGRGGSYRATAVDLLCDECARKWAEANDLVLPPSPVVTGR